MPRPRRHTVDIPQSNVEPTGQHQNTRSRSNSISNVASTLVDSSTSSATSSTSSSSSSESGVVDFSNISSVARLINTDHVAIYNNSHVTTEELRNLQMNTKGYTNQKARTVARFLTILSNHPNLSNLALSILDPHGDGVTEEYQFIILTRGTKTKAKYDVLNSVLLIFSLNAKMAGYEEVDLSERYENI